MKTAIAIIFLVLFSSSLFSQKYSPELQEKINIINKWNTEWYRPLMRKVVSMDEDNLRLVYEKVSEIWWKRQIEENGWEKQEEEIPSTREELIERISFRLDWLSQDNAMKKLRIKKLTGLY